MRLYGESCQKLVLYEADVLFHTDEQQCRIESPARPKT